ncbi:MAG TPA: RdgB/HAM1 family non-canonical purine NTP pyrophosphatase [Acidobacteriaceae bacterium]|nr:RdgB/HAM1 family non-canonical purine NTP pyrophosphatase [Acidobacteriaceae bacterium]
MTLTLWAATTNPGKLRDFAVAAEASGIRVEALPNLEGIPAPHEDQPTFAGNASLKAAYYSRFADGTVLADDSGLEVDAIGGEPGVRSARYAQDLGFDSTEARTTDERNNLCLLARMEGIRQRRARYHCVLALACSGEVLVTADGSVEGEILTAPRGTGGFGYDPLFYLPELQRTMAEIPLEEKHTLSHRGRAFRALLPKLAGLHRK